MIIAAESDTAVVLNPNSGYDILIIARRKHTFERN
jgi:hypothetical protein